MITYDLKVRRFSKLFISCLKFIFSVYDCSRDPFCEDDEILLGLSIAAKPQPKNISRIEPVTTNDY